MDEITLTWLNKNYSIKNHSIDKLLISLTDRNSNLVREKSEIVDRIVEYFNYDANRPEIDLYIQFWVKNKLNEFLIEHSNKISIFRTTTGWAIRFKDLACIFDSDDINYCDCIAYGIVSLYLEDWVEDKKIEITEKEMKLCY